MTTVDQVGQVWAEHRPQVVATLARRLGDLQLAEDAVQEAYLAAARRWPIDGLPDRPGAWLTTTAWRKAVDVQRQQRFPLLNGEQRVGVDPGTEDEHPGRDPVAAADDVLALTLACCHPSLSPEAQVALTLRHVVGLTDREVAARLLVAGPTLTKRLVRARAKIRDAGIGFEVPTTEHLPGRVNEVRTVVHLLFTQGYADPARGRELCEEAIWLGRQLHRLLPGDSETAALHALMLLHHSRWAARWVDGRLVPYDEQDRGRWDGAAVERAKRLLAGVEEPGAYGLHAAIALLRAATEPRWPLIADLYTALARLDESPVVCVNRAVAVGRADGPQAGLAALAPLLDDPRVSGSVSLLAARAELLERAGDHSAEAGWRRAAAAARNDAEREHLLSRAQRAAADRRDQDSER